MQPGIKNKLFHIKQKITALLFLSCLLLAITPKETLHDLFAHHTDGAYLISHNTGKTQLAKDSIHCHFDSIFTVNTLFALAATSLIKPEIYSFSKKIIFQPVFLNQLTASSFLRGPPATDDLNKS